MNIVIAITTRNRRGVFQKSYEQIIKYAPPKAKIVVVDDASTTPYAGVTLQDSTITYRFNENVGIPVAKNKCLSIAYKLKADHIFLFDSDTYPIHQDWWQPYVMSPEPHLMYQFKLPSKRKGDMSIVHKDEYHVAYTHTRGCMLYFERRVLDEVGGFDTTYGLGVYEHPDLTNRIHNAGLTTYRAMDVVGSKELIYCMDQDGGVDSTLDKKLKRENTINNAAYYQRSKTSSAYKEFK